MGKTVPLLFFKHYCLLVADSSLILNLMLINTNHGINYLLFFGANVTSRIPLN